MSKGQTTILVVFIVAIAAVGIAMLTDERRNEVIINDFVEPTFERASVLGVPQNLEKELNYASLKVENIFTVSMCRDAVVKDNSAIVYFTSHETNTVWVKLQILDGKGNLLGETGLLKPGTYVETVALREVPKKDTLVTVKLLSYEPDTYYSMGTAGAQIMLHAE
ncbi:MAG: hypothetical protein IJC68_04335 [Firmicutes bacterium]|nr:hypothetical protein [Bacillota bacterium]